MPDTKVGSAGDGAPLPAREPKPRRLPPAYNGTEQRLDALLGVLDEVLHELRQVRLDAAGLDQVKEGDPVLELTEPVVPTSAPVELTEPAPGPAAPIVEPAPAPPAKKAAAKRAVAKKAAPKR